MYIISIGGGLGNQMFQYAFYLSMISKNPGLEIKLDVFNLFPDNPHNGYELEKIFHIKPEHATSKEILLLADYAGKGIKCHSLLNLLFKLKKIFWGRKPSHIRVNYPTEYIPDVYKLNASYSYIFQGNWINEKYFSDISEIIRETYKFPDIDDTINLKYLTQITTAESVSIHVRRGDYVGTSLDVVSEEYYSNAIKYIKCHVKNPVFFVFSNDLGYTKDLFSDLDNVVYVCGNSGINSFRDMQLMSQCKHNIITNSTFSFWGAWLNTYNDAIKIYPNVHVDGCDYLDVIGSEDWIGL